MARYPHVKAYVDEQRFDAALDEIERIDKRTSRLLYLYEKGLVLHYSGRHEESNLAFEEAERLYEDLYTKSLSREIGALITSDNVIQYRGERYEAALVHYYKILNYVHLSDIDGAVVECRSLNNRLRAFADGGDDAYADDPFLQFLAGMVYLEAGEMSDADVSFRAADRAYGALAARYSIEIPATLGCALEFMEAFYGGAPAEGAGDEERDCGAFRAGAGRGAVNIFLECGHAPHKIEQNIVLPIYKGECDGDTDSDEFARILTGRHGEAVRDDVRLEYLLRVAVPDLVSPPETFGALSVRATVDGRVESARADVVANLEAVAFEAFEARRGAILLKTVTRALVKYLAKEGADDKSEVAGWLVNLFNAASESADARSWSTLPRTIRMARLVLPEGTHDLEIVIEGSDAGGEEIHVIEDVRVVPGRSAFLNFRIN
jgi:hypothetical protein